MKKAICTYFVLFIAIIMGVCGTMNSVEAGRQDRDTIFQVSLLQGLTFGDYHGNVTVKELKRHQALSVRHLIYQRYQYQYCHGVLIL